MSGWPLDSESLQKFTSWAIFKRNLKASTVQSYIASLDLFHKLHKFEMEPFNDPILRSLLKGAENLSFYKDLTKGTRKVMTLPLLKILSHEIAKSDWQSYDKQVL